MTPYIGVVFISNLIAFLLAFIGLGRAIVNGQNIYEPSLCSPQAEKSSTSHRIEVNLKHWNLKL